MPPFVGTPVGKLFAEDRDRLALELEPGGGAKNEQPNR